MKRDAHNPKDAPVLRRGHGHQRRHSVVVAMVTQANDDHHKHGICHDDNAGDGIAVPIIQLMPMATGRMRTMPATCG